MAATLSNPGDRLDFTFEGFAFTFRYCPPGVFLMGSPETERGRTEFEKQRRVVLTKGFGVLETPVTQVFWRVVMGNDPSERRGDLLPVENVSWFDCQNFINKLNDLSVPPPGLRFDLPTEAQWEYACRAGTTSAYYFDETFCAGRANCDERAIGGVYRGETTPVGAFPANPWGLFDMCGNVWEWTRDWFGEYANDDFVDPRGPKSGEYKVLRGGSWHSTPDRVRSAFRHKDPPDHRHGYLGFRLVLVPTR